MKISRWTFPSTPFLHLTFHHTTYHSGLDNHDDDHAHPAGLENHDDHHADDNIDEGHAIRYPTYHEGVAGWQ